ncbi:MAG: hypothetical protein BMS9Abin31_1005 [Gammaproteobacteria bacterium]|nr:MAG: hypothetical protein BMS9Abin31_1005 [Gammaproteobacteria bacterium]
MTFLYRKTPWLILTWVLVAGLVYSLSHNTISTQKDEYEISAPLYHWMNKLGIEPTDSPRKVGNIIFYDQQNLPHSLKEFSYKNRLILIWATWCDPCRDEMPYLDSIYSEMTQQGVWLFPVSVDQAGTRKIKFFYESVGINHLPIYNDTGIELLEALNIGPIPTIIAINQHGYEVGRRVGILSLPNTIISQ